MGLFIGGLATSSSCSSAPGSYWLLVILNELSQKCNLLLLLIFLSMEDGARWFVQQWLHG